MGNAQDVGVGVDDVAGATQNRAVDDGTIGDIISPRVQEKRRCFAERTAEIAAILVQAEGRFAGRIRIPGVEGGVGEIVVEGAFEFFRARLGEDFDGAIADTIVLWREGILVDADLANGVFGRQVAAAEAVDKDGAAVGAGGRSGEGHEVGGEVFGLVAEGFEVLAAQHEGGGVVAGVGCDGIGRAVDV